jgi:hypothetical protein
MMRSLSICAILAVSGCASTPVEPPIGFPVCEPPIRVNEQIWNDLGLLREVITFNSLKDGECILKLKARIKAHDENL